MIQTRPTRLKMPVDILLFGVILSLIVIGLWMVFDSSYVKSLDDANTNHDAYFFVKKQLFGVVAGAIAMMVTLRVGYWHWRRWSVVGMILGIILLCLALVGPFKHLENGASRWIHFGGPLQFQPSEIAKLLLIVYLAAVLSRPNIKIRDFANGLLPPLIVTGLYCLLIEREPDLGTAIVLFLTVMLLFFFAGARKRHLALILGGAGLLVAIMGFGYGHRTSRIDVYLHPEKYKAGIGYQVYHAKLAVGSGGWMGAGWGQGREKYYLPQGNTDFIFATVAEEFGFLRTLPLLALLCIVSWRGFRIATQCKDRFGSLLAAGITALIGWQALINLAVATASIPATGVPLPFISYGSTSLVVLMGSIGLLLNIAQHPQPPAEASKKKK